MKKKFLTFLLAICLIIPCMFMLTACGEKAKFNVNINIFTNGTQTELKDGVEEIRLVDASNYNSNSYTDFPIISKDIGKEVTKFEVEEGSKLILFMVLEPGYEINNVKIKPDGYNGTAISPEVFDNYDASGSWVYAFNLTSSLNKELWVIFEGAPARRMQTISLAQTNAQYFDQLKPGSGDDVVPASQVLENAQFTLSSTSNIVFSNITITELTEKINSNFSFEIPAGETLTLQVSTGFESPEGYLGVIDLSNASIYDTIDYTQSYSSYSSSLETKYYQNGTINFDWTKFASNNLVYSVNFSACFSECNGGMVGRNIASIKASNGSVLSKCNTDDNIVTFSEYFNHYHSGIKIEVPISKAEYEFISDSTSELVIDLHTRYTIAEAKAQELISVDDEENPTSITVTIKNYAIQYSRDIVIEFVYSRDSLRNNQNLKQIELQVDVENGEEGPYEIAKYFSYYGDDNGSIADLIYDNFDSDDYSIPTNYNGYYYKDTTIKVVADVAFTTEKSYGWEYSGVYENKTFKLIINEIEFTVSATDIYPEEENTFWQWTIEGTTPTWLVVNYEHDRQTKLDFTIDTEAFKEATGQDLALIKIDM